MITYKDFPVTYTRESGLRYDHIVVRYDNGTPIDRFEVWQQNNGQWLGWIHTTVSESLLLLRQEILADINKKGVTP